MDAFVKFKGIKGSTANIVVADKMKTILDKCGY